MDDRLDSAPDEEASRGLFASLRSLIDRVLAVLQTRGELLSTELEEEVTRLVGVLVWSGSDASCPVTCCFSIPASSSVMSAFTWASGSSCTSPPAPG